MLKHQFSEKTSLVGFAPLPPSGLLVIMATIPDRAPSIPRLVSNATAGELIRSSRVQGTDFMDFALQSERYERR